MSREEGENRRGTEIYINAGKGGSLTVIVCWEASIYTAQQECGEERSEKMGMKSHHRVTPQRKAQVKVPEEDKRRGNLPNQVNQIIGGDRATCG